MLINLVYNQIPQGKEHITGYLMNLGIYAMCGEKVATRIDEQEL